MDKIYSDMGIHGTLWQSRHAKVERSGTTIPEALYSSHAGWGTTVREAIVRSYCAPQAK